MKIDDDQLETNNLNLYRHLAGEDLSGLGAKELRQLERQLKTGVERVRCKKVMKPFHLS